MQKYKLILSILFLFHPSIFAQSNFKVLRGGELISSFSHSELEKKFKIEDLKVFDHEIKAEVSYKAFPLVEILKTVYESKWLETDEIMFTCADGYQPSISLQAILNQKPYLAFARSDGKDFSFQHEKKGKVPLGPYYVVWPEQAEKNNHDIDEANWAYQVVTIDIVSFEKKYPNIVPLAKDLENKKVAEGFKLFRTHCLKCHKINSQGGDMGPELNIPYNVTEYFDHKVLTKWIENPESVRAKSKMPNFTKLNESDKHAIKNIIAYLKAMKNKKITQP